MGSITMSEFIFDSFKIDHIKFEMKPNSNLIGFKGMIDPALWEIQIDFRDPQYFQNENFYITGLIIRMSVFERGADGIKIEQTPPLINFSAGIIGKFLSKDGRFPKEIEDNFVKSNAPAILLPHLRALVSSSFALMGFGTVIVPLINIHETAKNVYKDKEINIVLG